MQYQSIVQKRGSISHWPEHQGDRIYMLPFFKEAGLPDSAKRWSGVVDEMLDGIETDLPIYLMVDQAFVLAGKFHRRPGVHIDGYWGGKWQHVSAHGPTNGVVPPHHKPSGSHSYIPPAIDRHRPAPHHSYMPPSHPHSPSPSRHSSGANDWASATYTEPEAIILASNISACRSYSGSFFGPIGDMGDCATIDISSMAIEDMASDTVYAGNVTMLHETTPCEFDCLRTVVRLNVPGWSPEYAR